MRKWEYLTAESQNSCSRSIINSRGADGWELVAAQYLEMGDAWKFIFKRPVLESKGEFREGKYECGCVVRSDGVVRCELHS